MDTLFISVLNMSLTASYVIAAIMLARLFLKKTPKIISYILWAVAGFRLMFPFSFESIFSLIPFKSQPIPQTAALGENVSFGSAAGAALRSVGDAANGGLGTVTVYLGKTADGYPVTTEAYHSEVWLMFGSYLWLIGIATLLIYSVVSIILLKRHLRGAVLTEGNIYEAENLKTPFVLGFFRPKIYIPSGLSAEEKIYIILHEQTHIRRFDHVVKLAAFLILCVHWFNPLVWGAFLLMSADMEMSCDERVLKEMDGDIKKAYSISLLSLATGRSLINGSPLAFGEGNIKGRIKNVLNFKKPAAWVIAVSIVLVTVLSVGFAANRAAPDSTGWQDIRIGMLRDDVHKIMGEPVGMLSGLFGDIYTLDDGSGIIIYYGSDSSVYHIKLREQPAEPSPSPASEGLIDAPDAPSEAPELIANADLDRDGRVEAIYLDKSQMEATFDITLRVLDSSGNEIWSESANAAHAGWNSLFLCGIESKYYLLRYNPTMYQGYCTYIYTLFTLEGDVESVVQSNTLEFDINGTKELDAPKMVAFADEVNALLGKSILLISTEGGDYTFGPSSADTFFERYSWLDGMPKLYSESDDLETRLIKYSEYAVSNRRISEDKTYIVTDSEIAAAKDTAFSYYKNTVFKDRVTDIIQISDVAEYKSAIIPQRIKDVVIAFYVTISDNSKRMIVLTKETVGEWEVINEGV